MSGESIKMKISITVLLMHGKIFHKEKSSPKQHCSKVVKGDESVFDIFNCNVNDFFSLENNFFDDKKNYQKLDPLTYKTLIFQQHHKMSFH